MRNRWKFKRKLSFLNKYINGTNGVISLFLALLMVPFASIAGVLVNSARINSSIAMFDEALCNASNSTLATYDDFLRERFGLLAMQQNTSAHGSNYTVQQLIQDTFKGYMDKNINVLSNTYETTDVSASGIYPLADTDVLLSQVYEASKYTVPAKLVIDGLSIDDILKDLTKDLSFVSSIFNAFSSSAGLIDKIKNCESKFSSLNNELESLKTDRTNYDNAYNEFKTSVDEYNSVIDEINNRKSEIQKQIDDLKTDINETEKKFKEEKEKVPELSKKIEELENEKDINGNPVDNKEKIKKIEEDNKDTLKDYLEAKNDLKEKQDDLEKKNKSINEIENSYKNTLDNKRQTINNKKTNYVSKIDSFAARVLSAGNAASDAQNSVVQLYSAGQTLLSDVTNVVYEGRKSHIDNKISGFKEQKEEAQKEGRTQDVESYDEEIANLKADKIDIENESTFDKADDKENMAIANSLKQFAQENLIEKYQLLYGNLIELRNNVQSNYIVTTEVKKMSDTSSYYISGINDILTKEQVDNLQQNLLNELISDGLFMHFNAMITYIKAIFKVDTLWNVELCGLINEEYYNNNIGGLPSKKVRTDGSKYSLKSPFAENDKKQSDYFKTAIGSYSSTLYATGSVSGLGTLVSKIISSLDDLSECSDITKWKLTEIWSNLKKFATAIWDLVSSFIELFTKIQQVLTQTAIGEKLLLSGYIAYNLSNRTTYDGSALLGKSYKEVLPNAASEKNGYSFYGAETEYILNGSYSELDNQAAVFSIMWIIRCLFNIYPVFFANNEIKAMATAASVIPGASIFVYILYFLVETTADTVILVNGGDVSLIKTKPYMTPTGFNDYISAMSSMKLNYSEKNNVYKDVVKATGIEGLSEDYQEPNKEGVKGKINKINYTKMLIVVMMFMDSKTLVNRLADIIQMESTYYVVTKINTYVFDLDKCFTYLRASGKFSTNQFIKLSNSSKIYSKNRIVYRGY